VLAALVAKERAVTVDVVACIAEVEARQLYRAAGYPSMYTYCIGVLHLTEAAAYKRIHAARAAMRFPAIFDALVDGRLHLTAVVMLAPHLTPANADELFAAATHRTRREIEQLLAERFPKPDLPELIRPLLPAPVHIAPKESADFTNSSARPTTTLAAELAPGRVEPAGDQPAPGQTEGPVILGQMGLEAASRNADARARVAPLAPQRYGVQFTLDQAGHDLLRHVQDLLGRQVVAGDIAEVVVRALKVYAAKLEKQKLAATEQPRPARCPRPGSRHIPAHVKRAVWERDGGQCTFVSESGHRCEARSSLEWDHIQEFARGGEATVDGIQLRCRAHNQYTAECTYGAQFMDGKREAACREREEANARRVAAT
jgi:hypothetical protein